MDNQSYSIDVTLVSGWDLLWFKKFKWKNVDIQSTRSCWWESMIMKTKINCHSMYFVPTLRISLVLCVCVSRGQGPMDVSILAIQSSKGVLFGVNLVCICTWSLAVHIWALMFWMTFPSWWGKATSEPNLLHGSWWSSGQLSPHENCAPRTDNWYNLHCHFRCNVSILSLKHNRQHQTKPCFFHLWVPQVDKLIAPVHTFW